MSGILIAAATTSMAIACAVLRLRFVCAHDADSARSHHVNTDSHLDVDGRTMHLRLRACDVAPRILSVGDAGRASRIAAFLDGGGATSVTRSSRGFVTHFGTYNGVPVSVIATGMGGAMMDFVVRECRMVLQGPMAVLRLGTCGGVSPSATPGAVVVASGGSVLVRRDADTVAGIIEHENDVLSRTDGGRTLCATPTLPYSITGVAKPHPALAALVRFVRICVLPTL